MRTYGKIESAFWQNPKVRKLSDDAKLLLVYIYSTPHGNSIGCFVLPDGYMMADMGWAQERVAERVAELVKSAFIERDPESNLIRIVGWFEHNTLENPNVMRAAIRTFKCLPESSIFLSLLSELEELGNEFRNEYVDGFTNALRNEYRNPEPDPEPKPDPDPEPKGSEPCASAKSFFERCFELATAHFPKLTPANVSTIYAWETAGYDFERHVKPAIDSAKRKGASPRSFNFFTGAIQDAANLKLPPALKAAAEGVVSAASPDEKLRQRAWYLRNGIQHKEYNPEGLTVKGAAA